MGGEPLGRLQQTGLRTQGLYPILNNIAIDRFYRTETDYDTLKKA
jgi:hypothetical protein